MKVYKLMKMDYLIFRSNFYIIYKYIYIYANVIEPFTTYNFFFQGTNEIFPFLKKKKKEDKNYL